MVTIKEIAEKAGVSRGTVDRVLHDRGRVDPEKERRIRQIAEELGYQPNIAAKGLAARKMHLRLGFIYIDLDVAPFHRQIYAGAADYAKTLSPYDVEVVFFPLRNPGVNAQTWRDVLSDLIAGTNGGLQMDGWAVPGALAIYLQEMMDSGALKDAPLVLYNLDADVPGKIAYVGCDYRQAGRLSCGVAALMTHESGNVVIASQDTGNVPSSLERMQGFEEEAAAHYPSLKICGKVLLRPENMPDDFVNRLEALLAPGDIDILYLLNPGDYTICKTIAQMFPGGSPRIITNDLPDESQYSLFETGVISAVICQEPEMQGARPLKILFRYLALGLEPETDWYRTQLSVRIRQNIIV